LNARHAFDIEQIVGSGIPAALGCACKSRGFIKEAT
jgi:hypothetical protein